MAGGRDATGRVVGIGPRADDRRIADAPVPLVRHATGRGTRGDVAVAVDGDRADGPERTVGGRDVVISQRGVLAVVLLLFEGLLQRLPAPGGPEVDGIDLRE